MDTSLGSLIGDACAVTAYEFDLQMVQRIDVGKTVLDGSGQCDVIGQALLGTGDELQCIRGQMPFGFNRFEYFFALARIADQFGITRSQRQVGFSHHHVHVGEQRAEKRPVLVHAAQQRQRLRA